MYFNMLYIVLFIIFKTCDQHSQWPEAVAENMQDQAQDDARWFGSVNMQKPISCVSGGDWRASFSKAYLPWEVGNSLKWRQLRMNPKIFLGIYPLLPTINRDILLHL
jgi:hypothetical protein